LAKRVSWIKQRHKLHHHRSILASKQPRLRRQLYGNNTEGFRKNLATRICNLTQIARTSQVPRSSIDRSAWR